MLSYLDSVAGRVSTLLFLATVLDRIIPHSIKNTVAKYYDILLNYLNPYVHITFDERPRESFYWRSKAYVAIERSLALSMDDFEVITDTFEGVKNCLCALELRSFIVFLDPVQHIIVMCNYKIHYKTAQFYKRKDYYKRIGKPWKSTMIVAMANFLSYDVYDLELTAVEDNTTLRALIMDVSKRAIVVIEEIDCSLEITRKRRSKKDESEKEDDEKKKKSKVTLSGLLNFMDGLWSASGGERIFILTTNYKEKLDQTLVRSGRMDKHIEMSYCCYEAFRVLAKNYLQIEYHEKFDEIRCLLSEKEMSPADVAENLMPKTAGVGVDECLERLIEALTKSTGAGVEDMVTETDLGSDTSKDTDMEADSDTTES